MLLVNPALLFGGSALLLHELVLSARNLQPPWLIGIAIACQTLAIILLCGQFTLQPNEARVFILFGALSRRGGPERILLSQSL
ncbi:MAG TPA: hypothetical protein VGF73_10770 [Chthoniobacterales bacterium]|jgi:hypothetical protein